MTREREGWSPRQLADYIGMSHDFVLSEIRDKALKASRFGGSWRIHIEEVDRYCRACGWPAPRPTKRP